MTPNLFHPTTAVTLALVSSLAIPYLSSLLSRPHWPNGVAGYITLFLSAVSGFVTEWAQSSDATHYDWTTAAEIALSSFAIAAFSRARLLQGTKTDATLLAFPRRLPAAEPEKAAA